MACNRCGNSFGLFRKEHACKNCGFSFCGSCLTKKVVVKNGKQSVCNKCFDLLSTESGKDSVRLQQTQRPPSPPMALQKRMEALAHSDSISSTATPLCMGTSKNLDPCDQAILRRLENLRADEKPTVALSTEGIEKKLAQLKGVDPDRYTSNKKSYNLIKPPASNVEQTEQLFNQVSEEVALDATLPKPEEEIAERLARLRGVEKSTTSQMTDGSSSQNAESINDVDHLLHTTKQDCSRQHHVTQKTSVEDQAKNMLAQAKSIFKSRKGSRKQKLVEEHENDSLDQNEIASTVEQIMSQVKLDQKRKMEKVATSKQDEDTDDSDSTEFPWCTICNENATLRCFGCSGDLYCKRCFKECHDYFEADDHPHVPFKQPPPPTE